MISVTNGYYDYYNFDYDVVAKENNANDKNDNNNNSITHSTDTTMIIICDNC